MRSSLEMRGEAKIKMEIFRNLSVKREKTITSQLF